MERKSKTVFMAILGVAIVITAVADNAQHSTVPELDNGDDVSNGSDHGNHSDHGNGSHDSHHEHHGIHVASIKFEYVKQPLIVSLFMIAVVLCKLGFHHANFLSSWMPESCMLIILGTVVGGILHAAKVDTSDFYYIHPDSFFLFLLPPCILEAAYGLHDPVFFENLGTIIFYAVIGTILNCFIIGPTLYGLGACGAMGTLYMPLPLIECLVFSALIVAVDPVAVLAIFQEIGVNSVLYFLVFGESLLNDAVTVVLYNTITTLSKMEGPIPPSEIGLAFAAFFTVSLGGLSIGIIFGIFSALITRITQHVRAVEPLAIFSLAYAAYLMAELFHFSGIISMIGCGLMQVQYAFHNISHNSTITVKYFSKMLSGACDSIIFMFLGLALVRDDHMWNTGFVLWSAFLCLAVRFIVTYCLTFIANRTNRTRKVEMQEQFIMAYGGLRGAVAFCLVAMLNKVDVPNKDMFQTATLFVILFTVFIQGITIKPLVKLLRIRGDEKVISLCQEINDHVTDHILVFMEEVIGHYGHNTLKEWLDRVDDQYLKHWLQRDPVTKDEVIMELYQEIALQQHFENVYGFDLSSSRLELYQPEIQEKPAAVGVPAHPEIMRRSLDNYARHIIAIQRLSQVSNRRLTAGSTSFDEEELDRNVYDTVRSLPAVMVKGQTGRPEVQRFLSYEEQKKEPKKKSRRRRVSKLLGIDEDAECIENPTSKDLRKWMIRSPNKDAFSRHTDRNLTKADDSELLHLLHEKQRRHERFIRAQSLFSPSVTPNQYMSRAGSLSDLPDDDETGAENGKSSSQPGLKKASSMDDKLETPGENVPRMRHSTMDPQGTRKDKDDRKVRVRHKTVDFEGPQGHVKYTPRYVSKRAAGVNVVYRSSVPDAVAMSRGAPPKRLPSIDETQSAAIVNETSDTAGASSSQKEKSEAAALLPEAGKLPKGYSQKGRGHLKRQDADTKPAAPAVAPAAAPVQKVDTSEL